MNKQLMFCISNNLTKDEALELASKLQKGKEYFLGKILGADPGMSGEHDTGLKLRSCQTPVKLPPPRQCLTTKNAGAISMKTISILFLLILISGCGYTVLDLSGAPVEPHKQFQIYIDSADVPFKHVKIGTLSHSIPWQNTHFQFEPTLYEKSILLRRLESDARFYFADGLMKVRFYSERTYERSEPAGMYYQRYTAYGEAVMIRHVEEEKEGE